MAKQLARDHSRLFMGGGVATVIAFSNQSKPVESYA